MGTLCFVQYQSRKKTKIPFDENGELIHFSEQFDSDAT